MRKGSVLLIVISMFAFACATTSTTPQKTQLQIRELQTRTYDTNDANMLMKAILNVFQDDGYIVKNAVPELGLLTATKEVDVEKRNEAFWATFFYGANARWKKTSIIECNANVSQFGEQCRVRANFQIKYIDNEGVCLRVEQVQDEKYYRDFFSKVDKGIFIQQEKL